MKRVSTTFGDGKFKIEFAARRHLSQIVALGNETWKRHFEQFPANFEKQTAKGIQRKYNAEFSFWSWLTGSRAKTLCVALDGERVAGFIMWDDFKKENAAFILDVETHPEYRTQGVAKHLLAHAQNLLWKKGRTKISSVVWEGNPASSRLHSACGFAPIYVLYQIEKPKSV